jgi:hypothetical protein
VTSEARIPDHFRGCSWIWYDRDEFDLVNSWMQARRAIHLARAPREAFIHLSADSRYRLWVNGVHVSRGPARGFQSSWPYDTVDIGPFLAEGDNVLAVLVHNYGVGTFQYVHAGAAGLLAGGLVGEEDIATGPEWRVREAPGYGRTGARVSLELGFQERFDAREDDGSWLLPGYDDRGWDRPFCRAVGCMPWPALEPRGIPPLREGLERPQAILSLTEGKCGPGWRSCSNVVALYLEEERAWIYPDGSPRPSVGEGAVRIPAGGENRFAAVCLDFGREVVGSVILRVEGAEGGEVLDYLGCEAAEGTKPVVGAVDVGSRQAFGSRLVCSGGATEHEQFDHWGLRYLVVVARGAADDLTVSVCLRTVGYPLKVEASLRTSDRTIDRIYEACVTTQSLCMLDAHVDCPWREQAQWWGDARVQGRNAFYLSADARLFRRGLIQIGAQQVPDGPTYGVAPTSSHRCVLPDYSLVWLLSQWDYYWQTGDLELFGESISVVERLLAYFERQSAEEGLLGFDDRYWLFLDWFPLFRDGYPTLYNMLYLAALRSTAELFGLRGDDSAAERLLDEASLLQTVILDRLWEEEEGAFLGGLDRRLRPVRPGDPHSAAMAVLLQLIPDRHQSLVESHLLPVIEGEPDRSRTPSPYFMHYVLEALKMVGNGPEALDCILRWWGGMLNRGLTTTEEVWNADPGRESLCHAWSAHPIIHLTDLLLGVRQTAAGWKELVFSPSSLGPDSVVGRVATPRGPVEVSRRREGSLVSVELALPGDVAAEVRLPGRKPARVVGRRFGGSFDAGAESRSPFRSVPDPGLRRW